VDQELPAEIAVGVHYIYRRWHNILDDIDTNPNYEQIPFVNPVTGETIAIYSLQGGLRHMLLTNPEGLYRRYDGLEVYMNRRFINRLALSGSFVYSKTRGNVPNIRADDHFIGNVDDPNGLINFEGRVVNDPTYAWKFSGVYNFPYGFDIGFFYSHETGDTWEPLVEIGDIVNQGGWILGLPRGSYRLPSQNNLDLRVEKEFAISGGQFRLSADIFNALNKGDATEIDADWGSDTYGQPMNFVPPREIRLGIRYTF
jgi:hypothetical protein